MENTITIQRSILKAIRMIIMCLIFVATILFVYNHNGSPLKAEHYITGILGLLFFGLGACVIFISLFIKGGGLEVNDKRIVQYYQFRREPRFIPWKNIKDIGEYRVFSARMITIHVKFPESYIRKEKSEYNRRAMRSNLRNLGTPLQFSANMLKISHNDLVSLLRERLEKSKAKQS